MTIEATETTEPDFAAFEAAANSGEPVEQTDDKPADEPNPETNDTLELTEGDELVEEEEGEKKTRSKSAKQRIDELTRARREAERERDELRAQLAGKPAAPTVEIGDAPDPNDEKYEFGEADPQFIQDAIKHGVKAALAAEKAEAEQQSKAAEASQTLSTLDTNWADQEAKGAEKYEDFAEAIDDFKENAPCPPLVAIAIQASEVGNDVAYHLAKHQDTARLIAAELNGGDPMAAARRFGEIEGQYMEKAPVAPGADAHPLDHAIYAGRLKAFTEKGGVTKKQGKVVTDAPEPHKKQVRGAGGQFTTQGDTTDFAAFERKANSEATGRR